LWGEVSEVIDLFPGVLSKPVTVEEAWFEVSANDENLKLTPLYEKYWHMSKQGASLGKLKTTKRLSEDRPAFTMVKSEGNGGLYHPTIPRMLSYEEFKRISSYPDDYCKIGGRKNWQERLGNSVPPLLMKAIATQIRHKLWNGDPLTRYPKSMTYPEILEAAWQDHLKPKGPDAPTVISTFAGGGGSSLGYSMAGYRELLAVEWDNNAVETFKLNFPDVPVYHGDIAKLSVKECMKLAGLSEPGELDLLDGSPPCQGFSSAGKRILNDPRNQLFREYIRLLRGLKPKVFVMENVPGLVKGKMKLIFAEIMRELKASGYRVRCKKLNAMYFYVPQSRERLIFIGVRDDLEIEGSYPKAESRPIVVKNAWENISLEKDDLNYAKKIIDHRPSIAKWLKITPAGQQLSKYEPRGYFFNWARLCFDKVARSIPKEDTNICHPIEMRAICYSEAARLASFPDTFKFPCSPHQNRLRIGNSVPPFFMRSIAEHIKKCIFDYQFVI
jgi:DNA (cytosine-5)-methyltransferase 1